MDVLVLPVLRHAHLQHAKQFLLCQQLRSTHRENTFQGLVPMSFHDEHVRSQPSLLHAGIEDVQCTVISRQRTFIPFHSILTPFLHSLLTPFYKISSIHVETSLQISLTALCYLFVRQRLQPVL